MSGQDRQLVSSGTPWERNVGYSRAVRVGDLVYVSGTLGADAEGRILHPGDPRMQTIDALRKIETALKACGASLADVVRTRIYVVNMQDQVEVGRAHREVMGDTMPAATMVQVGPLANAQALVEVEVDAIVTRTDPA